MLPAQPAFVGTNTTTTSEHSDTIHNTKSPAPSLSSSRSNLSQSSSDSNLTHHIDHIHSTTMTTHTMSATTATTATTNDHMVCSNNNSERNQYPSIPSELIVYIFKFLSNPLDLRSAILVCKLWCSCGVDLLWSRPALLNIPLAIKMCDIMTLDRTQTIFPYATYIRRLNFSFLAQELTDETLIRFSGCSRLERLLLPGCNKITEEGLKQILQAGKGLYSLDLSEIPAVTDAVLDSVARFCPKLHTLYLAGCAALTDDAIMQLATSCSSLKRIKLSQCVLLTDRSILALTQNCPQLMEIDITNCNLMTNTAIQSVVQSLPQIRDINMTLLANLSDLAFSAIPLGSNSSALQLPSASLISHRFDQLRVLNLTSCVHITDETLARIIPAAPRLRNLTLTKCDRITDVGASVIKLLGKHLHYLHLGHCSRLTDRAIATLAQHCTRIRYLDLACCSKLTDAAVFAMAQLPKLRRIGLVKCTNITDHGIYAMLVSQIVPQTLERVHLSYCAHLSDTAVSALVSQCPKLTHLSVTGVPAFMSPKYQTFCRVPPSEFTPHQREVFCVFSGKGVRELRQYMQENPTMPSSTPSSIQRSYRIMGSTVASMVAGGQHSSAILAHLGLTLRETEAHVQQLAINNAFGEGSNTATGPEVTAMELADNAGSAIPGLAPSGPTPPTHLEELVPHSEDGSAAESLGLHPLMAELEQAGRDYADMMMQAVRHHHRHRPRHFGYQSHSHSHSVSSSASHEYAGQESSSSASPTMPMSMSSSSSPLPSYTHVHSPMCPHFTGNPHSYSREALAAPTTQQQDASNGGHAEGLGMAQPGEDHDVRMTSPSPTEDGTLGSGQQGESENGEGSSGGSGHGSPTDEEEEEGDLDENVFNDDGEDDYQRERSRGHRSSRQR
ncbi:SCF ubiquitin ligase complex subunit [Mortierella hygrophila]|uniref:SCF ubiquitin ligase complex subunit n=1 Tax=Mortierella hygrophila TaxID=979708 RepID=A0A9P6K3W7_9FUNG|nr:SCF ubiquitin ligase complex subunit [Mortierella hygrophila]